MNFYFNQYNKIYRFSPTLGYYDVEEEALLEDHEQAALVPIEGDKVLCVQCKKVLGTMFSAKRHYIAKHQPNQKARCQFCQKIYKNSNTRNAHMIQMHGVSATMLKRAVTMPSIPQ